MRVRLTGHGEATRVFQVIDVHFNTTTGELTLTCRDGKICLGLVGSWELSIESSLVRPMSCDEAERVHDGRALVLMN